MVVTHLFQVLGFVAMEPPTALEPKALRDEKAKVFDAMQPLDPRDVVRGQYEGYREEDGVAPKSGTETFVALARRDRQLALGGVPFFLRTGRRMAERRQVITLGLREPPLRMFPRRRASAPATRRERARDRLRRPGLDRATCFLAKEPGPGDGAPRGRR